MANVTMIYCLSKKADRRDLEKNRELAKLIVRQEYESFGLSIQGLYEAKRNFRCISNNPPYKNFIIAKGEMFLLCDGKSQAATVERLLRIARTKEEEDTAFCLMGLPEDEIVYETNQDSDFFSLDDDDSMEDSTTNDGKGSGDNDYLREIAFDIPEYAEEVLPEDQQGDDYVMCYKIHEATCNDYESTWGIHRLDTVSLVNDKSLQKSFAKMLKCNSAEKLLKIPDFERLVRALCLIAEEGNRTEPHNSIVLAVINGKNNHWKCGVWCYMRSENSPMEIHAIDWFSASGYVLSPKDGKMIPIFDDDYE